MTFSLPSTSCLLKLPNRDNGNSNDDTRNCWMRKNREFKSYDATVAKTSVKIVSSSLSSLFQFVQLLKAPGTAQELNLEMLCQSSERKFKFTYSVKLEKWPSHVAHLPRTGKK